MYTKFVHYRLPYPFVSTSSFSKKGPPPSTALARYSRKRGFEILDYEPLTKGGMTVCYIEKDGKWWVGVATCSMSDNFSYEKGRKIAFARAVEQINQDDVSYRSDDDIMPLIAKSNLLNFAGEAISAARAKKSQA